MELQRIGRYKIIEVVGEGAMGVVYRGHDPMIDRIVAIKTIKLLQDAASNVRDRVAKRFFDEARAVGLLTHPNIASIYDVGTEGGRYYLVFEHVKGVTLKQLIEQKTPHSLADKIRMVILIARSLHYAHQRGIIHKDIKPANIMVLEDLQIKILDFGIASPPDDEEASGGKPSISGTPAYMSPEQFSGQSLNRKTDIYSLGCVAYELFTLRKPFVGTDLVLLLQKVLTEVPDDLHSLNPNSDIEK